MLSKLTLRNAHRSFGNYAIYFLTLMLSVALFYAFNAVEGQEALQSLSVTKQLLADQMSIYITLASNILSVILAFLMIYANRFLLRRRNKELGIYMTLGMDKAKISILFVAETFLIGIFALAVGLLLGIGIAQGLSILVIKLFAVDMAQYRFILSLAALLKTVIAFGIMFAIIMIFNVFTVSKVKLIDLLTGSRKSERLLHLPKWLSATLFICSIVLLVFAFYLLKQGDGLLSNERTLIYLVLSLLLGTVLLFYSLSNVIMAIVQNNKTLYLKGLNTFLFRQISSKFHTSYISMSIICGLIAAAITILSVGMSIAITMNNSAEEATPYDMTVMASIEDKGEINVFDSSVAFGIPLDNYLSEHVEIAMYSSELLYENILMGRTDELWRLDEDLPTVEVPIVSLSDYNKVLQMIGKEAATLADDEFMLNCNYDGTLPIVQDFVSSSGKIEINGITLTAKKTLSQECIFLTAVTSSDRGTLIVPDSIANGLVKDVIVLNGIYKNDIDESAVVQSVSLYLDDPDEGYKYIVKFMIYDMYYGFQAVAAFLCIYIGIVFLIICVAILALQQLTETVDNIERYALLHKLGSQRELINSTLFRQIAVAFLAPLILGLIYALFISYETIHLLEVWANMNVGLNLMITFFTLIIVYGGYFMLTYHTCQKMIIEKEQGGYELG